MIIAVSTSVSSETKGKSNPAMAREKKYDPNEEMNPAGYMTTFSDLVTLLLTFFVLLITMSSMDVKSVKQAFGDFFSGASGPIGFSSQGSLEDLARFLEKLESVPTSILMEPKEIKDTLFQFQDVEFQRLMDLVDRDIRVTKDERGVVIQLADYILFSEGSAELRSEYLPILNRLADVMRVNMSPVSVEGHTDTSVLDGSTEAWAWELSMERAIAVMKYLTEEQGLMQDRFRVGGFGATKPVAPNDTPQNRAKNRRIEIILYKEKMG